MKWLVIGIFFFFSYGASAKDIELWHAFDGFLEEKFAELVDEFNAQGGHSQIRLVQKENYKVTYEEGVVAHREGKGPQILQVYEVATLSMMLDEGAYVPVGDLMQKYHHRFDPRCLY